MVVESISGDASSINSDGALGLAPPGPHYQNVLKNLFDNNAIEMEGFTTSFDGTSGTSWIDFGKPPNMNYETEYVYAGMSRVDATYW